MGRIKPLDADESRIEPWGHEMDRGFYVTLFMPLTAGWHQLSSDLGLSNDDDSFLLTGTMAGSEIAPHKKSLKCFSVEVVAKIPISLSDFPLAVIPGIFIELLGQVIQSEMQEVCRQRVFHHDEQASQDNMVRVSALDPGVPFIEKLGESGTIDTRLSASYSVADRNRWNKLLKPGLALIAGGKRPFAALIEALVKAAGGRPEEWTPKVLAQILTDAASRITNPNRITFPRLAQTINKHTLWHEPVTGDSLRKQVERKLKITGRTCITNLKSGHNPK